MEERCRGLTGLIRVDLGIGQPRVIINGGVDEPMPEQGVAVAAALAAGAVVQAVAARARSTDPGQDPLQVGARSRVRTRSGSWLVLYGTRLAGGGDDRTAVIIQPATPAAVAPLVTLAYGLSERESQVTRLCMQGVSTRQMAHALALSPHTVQGHLKSIFAKTGVRSRSELVGQIFLEHYVPRWEDLADVPAGWLAKASTM